MNFTFQKILLQDFEIRNSKFIIRNSLFLFSLLFQSVCFSQQDTAIVRTYGGAYYEEGRQIIECAAGGYAIIGTTGSDVQNNTNFYLLRIDEELNCMWSKSLGGIEVEWGYSLVEDEDGNLLLCGYTNSFGAGAYDALVYKVDAEGEIIWQHTYGGTDWDFAYKIIAHPQGGYLICGKTYSLGNGGSDGYLLHIDNDGNIITEWTYGGVGDDEFVDVEIDSENDIVVLANWEHLNNQNILRVMDLNLNGIAIWQYDKLIDGLTAKGNSLSVQGDEISVCGSRIGDLYSHGFYFVLDTSGDEIYYFTESPKSDFFYTDIDYVGDTAVITASTNGAGAGSFDAVVYYFQFDFFIGAPTYGDSGSDKFNKSIVNANGSLLSVGDYESIVNGQSDILVALHTHVVSGDYFQDLNFSEGCFSTEIENLNTSTRADIDAINYYDLLGRLISKDSINSQLTYGEIVLRETIYKDKSRRIEKIISPMNSYK